MTSASTKRAITFRIEICACDLSLVAPALGPDTGKGDWHGVDLVGDDDIGGKLCGRYRDDVIRRDGGTLNKNSAR